MKKMAEISTQAAGNDLNVADVPVYGTFSYEDGDWLKRKKKKVIKKTAALETAEGRGPGNKLIADRQPNVYDRDQEPEQGFVDNFMAAAQARKLNKRNFNKTAGWKERRDMLLDNADAMVTIFGYAGAKLRKKKRLQDQQQEECQMGFCNQFEKAAKAKTGSIGDALTYIGRSGGNFLKGVGSGIAEHARRGAEKMKTEPGEIKKLWKGVKDPKSFKAVGRAAASFAPHAAVVGGGLYAAHKLTAPSQYQDYPMAYY